MSNLDKFTERIARLVDRSLEEMEEQTDALTVQQVTSLEKINKNLCISYEEHLAIYDGLNTTRKLELLGITKGLEKKYYQQIWEDKQIATFELIKKFDVDEKLIRSEEHTSELQSH